MNLIEQTDSHAVESIASRIGRERRPGDVAIASIHWGGNWGYGIARSHRELAHRLVDEAGIDVVHGHSSHHPKAAELHDGRAILYGCGDLINDYEGIEGEDEYRPDLSLLWLLTLRPDGRCAALEMMPYRIARFRLDRPSGEDRRWLGERLDRECGRFGGSVAAARGPRGTDILRWTERGPDGTIDS